MRKAATAFRHRHRKWDKPFWVAISLLTVCGILLPFSRQTARQSMRTSRRSPATAAPGHVTWHRFLGSFNIPFQIALPDPASDHNTRVILNNWYEDAIGDMFRVMLSGRCTPNDVVVDIGANLSIFSATAAAYGCQVLAVEAQTRLIPYIRLTAAANHWGSRLEVRNTAVYDAPGELNIAYYDPVAGNYSGWLSMSMEKGALESCPNVKGCAIESVPVVPTHTLITSDTLLVKIDVDGPEAVITKALLPALDRYKIETIMVEIGPPGWQSMITRQDAMNVFRKLVNVYKYDIIILDQISFDTYKPGFLARCHAIEGIFKPIAYHVPADMLDELFDDSTTAINFKNTIFTDVRALMQRFAGSGAKYSGNVVVA